MRLSPSVIAVPGTSKPLYAVWSFSLEGSWLTRVQVKTADVVVAAIGKADLVKASWLKQGAVVIDVGINFIPG